MNVTECHRKSAVITKERVEARMPLVSAHPDAKRLTPPHPWHHPMYLKVPSIKDGSALTSLMLPDDHSRGSNEVVFLSATTHHVNRLDVAHWCSWLTTPIDFKGALERAAALFDKGCFLVEVGARPLLLMVAARTLRNCGVHIVASLPSMRREQPNAFWKAQRSALDAALTSAMHRSELTEMVIGLTHIMTHSHKVDADSPFMGAVLDSELVPAFTEVCAVPL